METEKLTTNEQHIRAMEHEELVRLLVHTTADGCPHEMGWECAKDFQGVCADFSRTYKSNCQKEVGK